MELENLQPKPSSSLGLNDIGAIELITAQEIVHQPFPKNKGLGAFILIDFLTNNTAGVGFIHKQWKALEQRLKTQLLPKILLIWSKLTLKTTTLMKKNLEVFVLQRYGQKGSMVRIRKILIQTTVEIADVADRYSNAP